MAEPISQGINDPEHPDRHATFRSLWRFLIVGGLSYLVDLGTLLLLHDGLNWSVGTATTGGYLTAFVVNFTLNRSWVFKAAHQPAEHQLGRYLILALVNYLLTLALMLVLTRATLNIAVSKTLTTALIAALNFLGFRACVFRR